MNPQLEHPANGPVAAAVLACGLGCFLLGVLAVAADGSKRFASALNFHNPTGPLSGVTLACWYGYPQHPRPGGDPRWIARTRWP